jgi:predicted MFS family arabinose efflux permease
MTTPKSNRLVAQVITAALLKLLLNTGRRFIYPFAPALSRDLGVPLSAVTSIIASSQAISLLGLFSGPLADRLGYRLMMQTGLAMLAAGMLLCGLLPDYWPLFFGLIIASFGKTVFDPAIQAFIGHTVPYAQRGRVIGFLEMSWAGSTLVGIPAFALIIDQAGFRFSFYFLAILGAVGCLSIARVIPADRPNSSSTRTAASILANLVELLANRPAAGMLAYGFWISLANDNLFVVYGAWFERDFLASIMTLGFSTIAIGSAELLGESMTALFADRLGLKKAVAGGLVFTSATYLLLPLIGTTLPLAMAGIFFIFASFEFTMVTSFSLCTELMPQRRATMMAGFYATAGIGRMIGVLAGGFFWQIGGIVAVSWVSAGATLLALLSLLWGLSTWKHVH